MAKHTPTPWSISEDCPTDIYRKFDKPKKDIKGTAIACLANGGTGENEFDMVYLAEGAEAMANAAFIVRACNAHDALLEAAEMVAEVDCECMPGGPDLPPEAFRPCFVCVTKKAIALAEGGEGA